jgi:hypothetical protein
MRWRPVCNTPVAGFALSIALAAQLHPDKLGSKRYRSSPPAPPLQAASPSKRRGDSVTGQYAINLSFPPVDPGAAAGDAARDAAPSIFQALQDQPGLKLDATRATVSW